MNKILFIITIIFILNNCGGFEFVYKTNKNDFLIHNAINIGVSGDDADRVYISLRDVVGDQEDSPKYRLLVNSAKTESAVVINKDATASKFKIEYSINYDFYNLYNNCKVFNKKITTVSTYSAKAAGYSFGTDMSQKESGAQNINNNINEFISSFNQLLDTDSCVGDD